MSTDSESLRPESQPAPAEVAFDSTESETPVPSAEEEQMVREMQKEIQTRWEELGLERSRPEIEKDVQSWNKRALDRLAEVEKSISAIKTYKEWSALRGALGIDASYLYPPQAELDSLENDISALPASKEKKDWRVKLEEMRDFLDKLQDPVADRYIEVRQRFEKEQAGFKEAYERFLGFLRREKFQGPSLAETKTSFQGMRKEAHLYPVKEEDLKKTVDIAEAVLSDPEETQNTLEEILGRIEKEAESIQKQRGRWSNQDRRRLNDLKGEEAAISDLLAEAKEKLFAKPEYSAETIAEYTLAQAFEPLLWAEEEKEAIQQLANNYLEVKNSPWTPEKKAILRDLMRAVWPRVNIVVCSGMEFKRYKGTPVMKRGGKKYNLDSQAALELFNLAGIPREKFKSALAQERAKKEGKMRFVGGWTRSFPPGAKQKIPGTIMLNMGGREGPVCAVRQQVKNWEKAGQIVTPAHYAKLSPAEKVLWCDHHGAFSGTSTSAAKYLFEVFKFVGFFDEDKIDPYCQTQGYTKEIIKEAIDYVTFEDNKSHPDWHKQKPGDWEKNSPRTILGLTSRLKFTKILDLAKEMGGIKDFTKILNDEEIKKLGLDAASEKQKKTVKETGEIKEILDRNKFAIVPQYEVRRKKKEEGGGEIRRFVDNGFIWEVKSHKYGTVLFTIGGFRGGIDAVRGRFGPETIYTIYNPDFRSLFISSSGQKLPKDLMPQTNGFRLREKMYIVPFGSAMFPSVREVLENLGVEEKDIKKVVSSLEKIQEQEAAEADTERLQEIASDHFSPFYQWLDKEFKIWQKENPKDKTQLRDLLGDRLSALLQGNIQDYLAYVVGWQKVEKQADKHFLSDIADDRMALKEQLLEAYRKRGWTKRDLEADLGPAYHDLFLDLRGKK